jgi:hypothetical protein
LSNWGEVGSFYVKLYSVYLTIEKGIVWAFKWFFKTIFALEIFIYELITMKPEIAAD